MIRIFMHIWIKIFVPINRLRTGKHIVIIISQVNSRHGMSGRSMFKVKLLQFQTTMNRFCYDCPTDLWVAVDGMQLSVYTGNSIWAYRLQGRSKRCKRFMRWPESKPSSRARLASLMCVQLLIDVAHRRLEGKKIILQIRVELDAKRDFWSE